MKSKIQSIVNCECGCGHPAPIATQTKVKWGHIAGKPMRFISGHGFVRHRQCGTPEYAAWRSIKQRCLNPKSKSFRRYGGRGIKMCDAWKNSFPKFFADVGSRPTELYSIERINNDGHYEQGNVKWATSSEQQRNTCRNRFVVYQGETLCLEDLAKKLNLTPGNLRYRVEVGKLKVTELRR